MTFDETLQRAFETLTDQLRDEIARQLAAARTDLAAVAAAERERAAEQAAADGRAAAEGDVAARLADAERDAAARLADAVAAAEAAAVARASAAAEARVQDAEARVQDAESRVQDAEARVHDAEDRAHEAQAAARASAVTQASTSTTALSARLVEAVRAIDRGGSLTEILDTLVSHASRETARVGVLLARGRRLHGWRFAGFEPPIESDYQLSVNDAGVAGEALRSGEAVIGDSGGSAAGPVFGSLPDGRRRVAVPIGLGGQHVAVLYADEGPGSSASPPVSTTWPETLEVLTRHAAHRLEAITAFQTARMLTEGPETRASLPPAAANVLPGAREDDHEAARRYARLLVSEIKLYHEAEVVAGRKERDLAVRLGGEIARARVLYEQRVPAAVRAEADHFHAELVRTLANGDAGLLEVKTEK